MQAARVAGLLATVASANGEETNPMAKVIELMDDCSAKVKADGEAEAKVYKEYYEWCDDASKNTGFAIKTAKAAKEKLESSISKLTSDIAVSGSKIEDLAAAIAEAEKELADATGIREKENADFVKAEAELVDGVDTLGRAIGILEREMAKNPAAFAQIDTSNMAKLTQAIGVVVDAAAFNAEDKSKLVALVQASADDDDDDAGAPAPDAYQSKSGGIVDVLAGMKEKAEGELSDLRKAESNAQHNFDMLKTSLTDSITADTKDKEDQTAFKSECEENKATAEGDLTAMVKDLAAGEKALATAQSTCMQVATDHEETVRSRTEELKVIAEAKQIVKDATSLLQGSGAQPYFL